MTTKKKVSTIMARQARTARPQLQRGAQRQLAIPRRQAVVASTAPAAGSPRTYSGRPSPGGRTAMASVGRLAAQKLDVARGRGLKGRAGAGADCRGPAPVDPVERIVLDRREDAADRRLGQRQPVRRAPDEGQPVLTRGHEDRVPGEQGTGA